MQIVLPLGVNIAEPVQLRVDNGDAERHQIGTCTNAGCSVSLTVNDKLLAAMRTGTLLKVTVEDGAKKPVELPLPLLGFALAYDKAK